MDASEEPSGGTTAPIFIFSCARSGSTLLRYILDTHPAIYAPPELTLGQLAEALLLMQHGLHGRRMRNDPSDLANAAILAAMRESIARTLDAETRRRGKAIWCEKSPQNLGQLEILEAVFPDARCICLYRNWLDTIYSCIEGSRYFFLPPIKDYTPRYPDSLLAATAQYWIDSATKLMELERRLGRRAYRVRYEDVVIRPAETLAGLFDFLDLPWQADLVDAVYKTPHDDGHGDLSVRFASGIHRDSIGRGRALPLTMLAAEQRSHMEEIDRELGYLELIAEILSVPAARPRLAAPPASQAAPTTEQDASWVFETYLPARLREQREALATLASSYLFSITGEGGGAWLLRRDDSGEMRVVADGLGGAQAATSIGLDAQDLLGIVAGRLNVIKMLHEGRIAWSGEPPSIEQVGLLAKLLSAAP